MTTTPAPSPVTTTAPAPASTGGWDVVHALHFDEVNRAIAEAHASPQTFSQVRPNPGGDITISGTFGDWRLVGGSQSIARLTVPIPSGSFGKAGSPVTFSDAEVDVEVHLEYLETGAASGSGSAVSTTGGSNNLKVAPPNGPVSVTGARGTGLESALHQQDVKTLIQPWFEQNLTAFAHAFATVDVAAQLAEANHLQWLMPQVVSYAIASPIVVDGQPIQPPVFAVLGMTLTKDPPGIPQFASPSAIPDGATSALLISRELFVSQMLLPAAPTLFVNPEADAFAIADDGVTITNHRRVELQSWQLPAPDSTIVDPWVDPAQFELSVSDDTLRLWFGDVAFEWGSSATAHLWFESLGHIALDANGHIDVTQDNLSFGGHVDMDPHMQLTYILVSVGITIFTMAVGAVAEGIASAGEAGEAAEAGEVSTTTGGATVADVSVDVGEGATLGQAENGVSSLEASEQEVAATSSGSTQPASSTGWFARNMPKLRSALIALLASAPSVILSHMPEILEAELQGELTKIPKLQTLADYAVTPVRWTGVPARVVVNASLNGSLVLGLAPAPPAPTPPAAPSSGSGSSEGDA